MNTEMEEKVHLLRVFAPDHYDVLMSIVKGNKTAHYTTASNAISILNGEQIWLRNACYMNDSTEINFGVSQIYGFFTDKNNENYELVQRLRHACNNIHENVFDEALKKFDTHFANLQNDTYFTCLSIHDINNDQNGKLSMWRGYGNGQPAVALVLNTEVHFQLTDVIGAYFTPVAYGNKTSYANSVVKSIERIEQYKNFLSTIDPLNLSFAIYESLIANSVGRKHLGFEEEKELRVLHIEHEHQPGKLEKVVETINGRPQSVMKLPLKDFSDEGVFGTRIEELLNHVIIGPTEYPEKLREAFIDVLRSKHISNAENRVAISDIPWRGW